MNQIPNIEDLYTKIDDYYRNNFDESQSRKKMFITELLHHQLQKVREEFKERIDGFLNGMKAEINISNEYKLGYRQALLDLKEAYHSELDQEKEEAIAKARDQEAKLWFETWYSHYISPTKPLTGEFAKFATERIQMTGYERDQALPTEDNK